MKLLESTRFEAINNALCIETGDSKICGRIESYSCKMAGGDKAMYKRFNSEGINPNDPPPLIYLINNPNTNYTIRLSSSLILSSLLPKSPPST